MEPQNIPGAPKLGKSVESSKPVAAKAIVVNEVFDDATNDVQQAPEQPDKPTLVDSRDTEDVAVEPEAAETTSQIPDAEAADEADVLNEHWEDPGDPDGVFAEDQKQQWLAAQHDQPVQERPKTKKSKPQWPLALLLIICIAAVLGVTYKFALHKTTKVAPAKTATSAKPASSSVSKPAQDTTDQTTATKNYNSSNFTLSFDYPSTWKVTDTTVKLSVLSPGLQFTQADGKIVSAHIIVTMQNQQTTIAGYPASGATAVQTSDQLSYKKPTSIQRAQTYVSYLGYSTASGLNALYVTGDSGYQLGQQVPLSDIVKGNPLIGVSFATCTSDDCASANPVTLLASSWKTSVANTLIANLIESLQLN